MTVRELKEFLSHYPDDQLALVEGYEGGYSDIALIKQVKVRLNVHKEEWMGPHDQDTDGKTSAVVLIREWNNPNSRS